MSATRITPRGEVKDQITRKMHVIFLIMQKSNMRSDRRNLCPLLALALYMLICVKAPSINNIKNTIVTGTSGRGAGKPPGNAPFAGSGSLLTADDVTCVPDESIAAIAGEVKAVLVGSDGIR